MTSRAMSSDVLRERVGRPRMNASARAVRIRLIDARGLAPNVM